MAVYHQMGHDSENLVFDEELENYKGAILSPVNRDQADIERHVGGFRSKKDRFDIIFDPQLYFPRGQMETLRQWSYFPKALETHEQSDLNWWKGIVAELVSCCDTFKPNAICSPMLLPRCNLTSDYYDLSIQVGDNLFETVVGSDTRAIQTILVKLPELADIENVYRLASVITRAKCKEIYLVFTSEVPPRHELIPGDDVKGGMLLVSLLESANYEVIVGMSSSDMILWKAAGATSCATGKYFNLRRFSVSRFEETTKGGRVIPYCFEEDLLSFVREGDLLRLLDVNIMSDASNRNPAYQRIKRRLQVQGEYSPWLADSWRQFMFWFADAEKRLSDGLDAESMLILAEEGWDKVDESGILMEERKNDGSWIRLWRRALREFRTI